MDVLCKQTVERFLVEFDEDEVHNLRALGQLPPDCSIPASIWLTRAELKLTIELMGFQGQALNLVMAGVESAAPVVKNRPAVEGRITVHILVNGAPLCEFHDGPPALWGGDKWLHVGDVSDSRKREIEAQAIHRVCPECWTRVDWIHDAS